MAIICVGCQRSVEPIKVIAGEASGKEWLISRCPNTRCGFNIDIEPYGEHGGSADDKKNKRNAGRTFWNGHAWE